MFFITFTPHSLPVSSPDFLCQFIFSAHITATDDIILRKIVASASEFLSLAGVQTTAFSSICVNLQEYGYKHLFTNISVFNSQLKICLLKKQPFAHQLEVSNSINMIYLPVRVVVRGINYSSPRDILQLSDSSILTSIHISSCFRKNIFIKKCYKR